MMELSKVKNADLLVKARSDRRFASLWTQKDFDDITNPHEIAARDLAHKAEMAKRFPNIAMVMMRYASALRAVGESEKAVAVAREALANPELTSTNKERELEDKLWLRNELVYALKDLGRTEEMFSEMQPILKLDETKSAAMVAQLINFGEIMSEFDRGAEGLKTAQRAWNIASPLGKMFVHMVDVCVNAETDKAAAEKALSLLRKEQSENYAAMTEALLCMDKTDDVAALLKKRLASPELRSAVLSAAQTYKQPTFVTPTRRKLMDRYAKVLARSDVQSAIKKYGRLETYPFVARYWGNF
jgi:tetratricopeptide (TPR) repeat protein